MKRLWVVALLLLASPAWAAGKPDKGKALTGETLALYNRVLATAIETRRMRREEAARIQERLDFLELWKKEENGEALAKEEVERIAAHLQQQGLLRKIEREREEHLERIQAEEDFALARERLNRRMHKERILSEMEIDSERLEHELQQAERLQAAFEQNGWLAVVRSAEDPEGRIRLLERLIACAAACKQPSQCPDEGKGDEESPESTVHRESLSRSTSAGRGRSIPLRSGKALLNHG